MEILTPNQERPTNMSNTTNQTEVAPVQAGDHVDFFSCPVQLPNWGVRGKIGTVELVRSRFGGTLEAYVVVNKVRWIFPVKWLRKVEVK